MSFTLWFTGMSGAGKSTLSKLVFLEFRRQGLKAEWLDGDIIRANIGQELGFSRRDRDINVRRLGFISHLLNRNGVISVVGAIAPYAEARLANRRLLSCYLEVFCDCPLDVLIARDPKGLYENALKGEISNFTGISDPYEVPEQPDIRVLTGQETVEQSCAQILEALRRRGLLPEEQR
ncbi:MAG: adenylyl-sulfate kinase [Thermodesulfobacteriota bacterium]